MYNKKALTLVEIIVALTIIAILTTIGFISYTSYTSSARDAARGADVTNINRILSLHKTSKLIYPQASDSVTITYSGASLWQQGTFGTKTKNELGKIFGELQDPKHGNQYTYSVTNNRKEYQLGVLFENESQLSNFGANIALNLDLSPIISKANAAGEFSPIELSPKIWLDATDVDGDGDTNDNPGNGETVLTSWVNKSSAGSANNPTFTDGNLGYHATGYDGNYPGVFIDDDRGMLLDNSSITQGDIFYVVQNTRPFGGSFDSNGRGLQSANAGNRSIGYWGQRRDAIRIGNSPKYHNSSPATTSGRTGAYIYGFHTDNVNFAFYRTGTEREQGSTNSITNQTWAFNEAGANTQNGARADFIVSEILIFDTKLSTQDRQKIEGYLAHKWGQESDLPGSHPYKAAPPEGSGPPPVPDSTPDAFTFNDVTNADLSTIYESNEITIAGINSPADVTISGGEYSIDDGAYTSSNGTITVGQDIKVRVTSSSSNDTPVVATLDIGGVTEDYSVRTLIADVTPDTFTLNAVTDADISTTYTSNTVTISGMNTTADIGITGPGAEYKISDGIPFDATGAGTASASSTYSSNSPAHAFDNNTGSNGWGNNNSLPAQLEYDFGNGNSQIITKYTLYRSSSQSGGWNSWKYSPSNWTFEGSNDGSDWSVLDAQTNESISVNATKKEYSFTNASYYRYYRINISSADHPNDWVNITEMEMINEQGGGSFTSSDGTVDNGDIVTVRIPSSASAGTLARGTLTVGTYSANYDVTTVAPDTSPNDFSFSDENGAATSTQYRREFFVGGINAPTSVDITSGSGVFEINETGGDITSGTVNNGDKIRLKLTSPASASSSNNTELTVGDKSAIFNIYTAAPPPDTDPDAFTFIDVTDANLDQLYESNTITVSGINTGATISISGGQYDINDSNIYTSSNGTVYSGDEISVQATSDTDPNEDVDVLVTIGTGPSNQDTFTITTIPPDTSPDAFTLNTISNANINTVRQSDPVTINGINTATSVSISGAGEFSINGGSYVTSGTVDDGDNIVVQLESDSEWGNSVSTTLTVGTGPNNQSTFTVTNGAGDVDPDAFTFGSISDALLNRQYVSNTIPITGINAPATISITGGEYRIGTSGSFVSTDGTINNNDVVTVRQVSSVNGSTTTTAAVTIGSVTGNYTVTTQPFSVDSTPDIAIPTSNIYVSGEYNGLIAHAQDGDVHYIIATPSIMTYDTSDTDILSIIAGKKLVYNGFDNIPASYSGANLTLSGGFDFDISSPLLYQGNKEDLGAYGGLKQVDEGIRSIYKDFPNYKYVAEYLDDYSLSYIERIIGNIIGINPIKPYYCSDILESGLIYNIAPDATISGTPNTTWGAYGTGGIANGVKSTVGDLDYEYHSDTGNAIVEFEWEESQRIGYVRIYNRTGCCSNRLSGAVIKLYNDVGGLIYSHPLWDTTGDYVIDLDLEGIGHLHFVKKMTIESVAGNLLNFREVEIFLGGDIKSGIYKVDKDGLGGQSPYNVYCDMETDGGGWTRIGEDYVTNGTFASQFHIDQYTFPYGVDALGVNVIKSNTEVSPPIQLPEASVLLHNGGAGDSYPLYFPEIPGDYFAQEIRIAAWVKDAPGSIFSNVINYEDGSSSTQDNPDYEVLDTNDDGWEKQIVRIPLDGVVDDFTWNMGEGMSGPFYITGVEMEVYYK